MKVGISTATLFLRYNNEDAASLLREWNVPTSEVFLTSFCEYRESFAQLVKQRLGETKVHSVHVLNTQFEPQLYAENERVRADAFQWLANTMEAACALDAKYYTFHGIARIKRTFRENIDRFAKQTQEIFRFCQSYGVTLCYENVEWALYNRPGIFHRLKETCQNLKGVLDIKQARISGYDYRDYLKEMGQDIAHVHVSDIDTTGKLYLPGKGTFDFDELFLRLRDYGFNGAILIENYKNDYHAEEELKASFEWLSEKAEKYFS